MAKPKHKPAVAREPEFFDAVWKFLSDDPLSLLLAVLISVMMVARPWRDGLTYVGLNTYFVAVTLVVGGVAIGRWFRQARLRTHGPLLALLAGYLAIGWLTSRMGVDREAADRVYLNWCMYALLFFTVSSQLQSRTALRLLAGVLVVTVGVTALWAVLHRNIQLPLMRQQIHDMPHLLPVFFNSTVLTAELQDRLESNRAFGSFLFPNVLAAFLILFIPFVVSMTATAVSELRTIVTSKEWGTKAEREARFPYAILFGGLAVAAVAFLLAFSINEVAWRKLTLQDEAWSGGIGGRTLLYGILPLSVATGGFTLWYRMGRPCFWAVVRGLVSGGSAFFAIYALLLTYSRGATLALFLSCIAACIVFFGVRSWVKSMMQRGVAAGAVFAIAFGATTFGTAQVDDLKDWPYEYEGVGSYQQNQAGIEGNVPPQDPKQLNLEGQEFSAEDLTSTKSLRLRLTYWQVALKMAKDHWLTGVGWGGFGAAYQQYQFLTAGDVKQVHNDYLQAFAETGIFGYLTFSAFWAVFFIWGASVILAIPSMAARWELLGLYMGLLACAIHSFADFNFSNPSLATFAFIMAGLFVALAREASPDSMASAFALRLPLPAQRVLAGAAAIVLLLSAMLQFQMFTFDFERAHGSTRERLWNVGEDSVYRARYKVSNKLLLEMHEDAKEHQGDLNWRPNVNLTNLSYLFPDVTKATAFGWFGQLVSENGRDGVRLLRAGEAFPPNTLLMIEMKDMNAARPYVQDAVRIVIEQLEKEDEIYPHSYQHAEHIAQMYELLIRSIDRYNVPRAEDLAVLRPLTNTMVKWADIAIERCPTMPGLYAVKAQALWQMGRIADGANRQVDAYREGLTYYEKAHELAPATPMFLSKLGEQEQRFGSSLLDVPQLRGEGERLVQQGRRHLEEAGYMYQYKVQHTAESIR